MKRFIQCIPIVFLVTWGIVQAEENPVADVQWSSTKIKFVNAVAGTLALTVSGNSGEVYTQTDYADGEIPTFLAYDDAGPLPDGDYKYELEKAPESEEEPRLVQSGSFQIVAGVIEPYQQENNNEN